MTVPSVGRVVHFVTLSGHHLAAMITETYVGGPPEQVGLAVFDPHGQRTAFFGPVSHDEVKKHCDTWHWPERTDAEPQTT